MSFAQNVCFSGVTRLLMGRTLSPLTIVENMIKGIYEITTDYKFPGLEASGPVVNLVAFQANYSPNYFLQPGDADLDLNMVNSFFIYNNPFVAVTGGNYQVQTNSGYNLTYKTIDNIEVLLNIPGLPINWTRHEGEVWVTMPDNTYSIYMRYQKEHPWPSRNTTTEAAGNDLVLLPNDWQDIVEHITAMRCAREINLSNRANELYTILFGDTKFQSSDGVDGSPGLIAKRTSQRNRDQKTAPKRLRLRMGSV